MTRRDIIGAGGVLAALAGFVIGAVGIAAMTVWLRSHTVLTFAVYDRYYSVVTPLSYTCAALVVGGILAFMFSRRGPGSMWKAWGMAGIWLTLYVPALLVDRMVWSQPAKFWWVWLATAVFVAGVGAYARGALKSRRLAA